MSEKRTHPRPMSGFGPGAGMGMPVQKPKQFKATLKRLIGYLKPFRLHLLIVFITAILSTVFSIVSPKLLGDATNVLFEGVMSRMPGGSGEGVDFAAVMQIALVLVVLYFLSSGFAFIQQYMMAGVAQKTVYRLREDVSSKLSKLPLKFYDGRSNGDIMSRAINDDDVISNTLQQSLTQIITSGVTLLGIIVMMLTISPALTLIVILTLPLSFIAVATIAGRSQRYFKQQQAALGELNGHVEEMYGGHQVVKAYGREQRSISDFGGMNAKLYDAGWRAQFVSGIMMPLMMFIGNIGYVLVCVVGGILVTQRSITVGDVQAFIQYSRQFTQPIAQTANIANIIQSTIAAAERVFELLDEEEEKPDAGGEEAPHTPRGDVRFDNVMFGYSGGEPLIGNMNIDVKSGQTIAIVGPTGAGKTTLINLLMRFYEVNDGTITIDGTDITAMRRGALRGMFGMVLQDTWLFNGTIRDNIGYGREGAPEDDIVRAAQAAYADHFIRTLPEGYDTVLNEEASNISQGQKQLLTIARAILANPSILILDEATSSVDTRTEAHIQQAMAELMHGRTSFVIAHRLSTIRDADLILVMNHGDVIEKGSHEQLLAANGFYAELYNSQFTAATEDKQPQLRS